MLYEAFLFTELKHKTYNTMNWKFEKEFREAHPETIGETDREYDLDNYKDWLEQQLVNKNDLLQRVSGCSFINIEEQKPTLDDCGIEFLCKIKTPRGHRYEVAEWFNPAPDNEIWEDDKPHFNYRIGFCGQKSVEGKVVGWCRIE